jgi:predicted RNA binding protein YcfA (HicA-like mRNA interferase family)
VVTAAKAIRALERAGLVFDRQRGSHKTFRHPDVGRSVTVPDHGSRRLKPGILSDILDRAGLTVAEFRRLLP